MEAKIKIFQVFPESGTFRNNEEDCYQYKKQKRQLGKTFQAVVLRHVWNQCLGGSDQLLMPKDGIQSTNLIEKIGL